jgi:hypothetical protein
MYDPSPPPRRVIPHTAEAQDNDVYVVDDAETSGVWEVCVCAMKCVYAYVCVCVRVFICVCVFVCVLDCRRDQWSMGGLYLCAFVRLYVAPRKCHFSVV